MPNDEVTGHGWRAVATSSATPLATLLGATLPPSVSGERTLDEPATQQRLDAMLAEARAQWPGCEVSDADYVEHLASLLGDVDDVGAALAAVRGDDLYLACACGLGVPEALRAFEQHFIRPTRVVIAREGDVVDPDEFFQRLRERLLVAPHGKRSRLAGFSGKGKLSNWVRIAAQRMLIDEYRKREAPVSEVSDETIDPSRAADVDPELGVLHESFREDFQAAFEAAFAGLTSRERTLLRYRYVDGLEVNQIAAISGRHRVSVYRAILKARETLLEHLRRGMAERLHVGSSEADSVLRLMKSQLDVRLSRLFRSKA